MRHFVSIAFSLFLLSTSPTFAGLTAKTTATILYMTVVMRAGQEARLKDASPADVRGWCRSIVDLYGKHGTAVSRLVAAE